MFPVRVVVVDDFHDSIFFFSSNVSFLSWVWFNHVDILLSSTLKYNMIFSSFKFMMFRSAFALSLDGRQVLYLADDELS